MTDTELGDISEHEAGQLLAGDAEGGSEGAPAAQDGPGDPAEGEGAEDGHAGAEAARWRRRLRDVEGERDQLRERLTAMQRAEIERLAGEHMTKPADLWVVGTNIGDLLADNGRVDAAKVTETVQGIIAERPTWGLHHRSPVPQRPRERLRGGGDPDGPRAGTSWSDLLNAR